MPRTSSAPSVRPRRPPTPDLQAWTEALTRARGTGQRKPLRDAIRAAGASIALPLAARLDHPDALTRWEIVNLLGELAEPATLDALLEFALAEDEVHARWRSFWAICRMPHAALVERLLPVLRQRDTRRRWRAALILSMLRCPAASPVLRAGLDDADPWVQWEALSALKSLADTTAEAAILPFMAPDRALALRQEATLALAAIGTPSARARLVEALADAEPQVRWRASMGLSRSRDPVHHAALQRALQDETDVTVRAQFARDIATLENCHA